MKFLVYVLIFLLRCIQLYAQPPLKTTEDLQDHLKRLQKKADSLQKTIAGRNKNPNSGNRTISNQPQKITEENMENFRLSPIDSVKIKSIPQKVFTVSELNLYLSSLNEQLKKRFSIEVNASVNSIAQKLNNDPVKLEAAALLGRQNGANEEALLLIMKAALAKNTDALILTNTGAMLDMYKLSEKAIPILRTVIAHTPQNAIALNNLGQSFTALGMQDSALYYFGRCLSLSPEHPEANVTAGYIELGKGNQTKAQQYFENSLTGSFNIAAYKGLKSILKSKCRIKDIIKQKVKYPEYFNQFKYKLPRQCLNVDEAATVKKEYELYQQMMNRVIRKYSLLKKAVEKNMGAGWADNFNKRTMALVSSGKSYLRPFQVLGAVMEAETSLAYQEDIVKLEKFNTENREQYRQLEKEYEDVYEQLTKSGSYSCAAEKQLKNRYLERFAQLNEEWQSRNMLIENTYMDDYLLWPYFSALDSTDYKVRYYNSIYNYLYKINRLAQVKILEPCKETEAGDVEGPVENELKEFDCPVEIEFSFAVGKLSLDCDKISFKAGELIVFRFEKQFKGSRQSTITIGSGVSLDLMEKAGPIKAGFEVGAEMAAYFTFDAAGNCSDAGMTYGLNAKAALNFSVAATKRMTFKKDAGEIGVQTGYRFGINSGISFTTPGLN